MNHENQSLIIRILGCALIIVCLGSLLLALYGLPIEVLTAFVSVITAITGILATAFQGRREADIDNNTGNCEDDGYSDEVNTCVEGEA